jgi:hypothetical protein
MEQDPRGKGHAQAEAWVDKAAAAGSAAVPEPDRAAPVFAPNAAKESPTKLEPLVTKEHVQSAALR